VNGPERPIGDDDLQAYVDGRLAPDRVAAVEAYLEDHPDVAARIGAYRRQLQELKDRLRPKAEEPIPARLRVGAILAERRLSKHRHLRAIALSCIWLVIGSALGWSAKEALGPTMSLSEASVRLSSMLREAVSAHRIFVAEVAHPVEVKADQAAHLAQWITKRLGRSLPIPNLSGAGLKLMGGRVLPAGPETAAQLMYEDEQGTRVTLYVRAGESGQTAFRFAQHGDLLTFYWIDDGYGFVVSAMIDRDRLLKIAELVFHQLELSADGARKPAL
jgi:anti-sigma factor RsiW